MSQAPGFMAPPPGGRGGHAKKRTNSRKIFENKAKSNQSQHSKQSMCPRLDACALRGASQGNLVFTQNCYEQGLPRGAAGRIRIDKQNAPWSSLPKRMSIATRTPPLPHPTSQTTEGGGTIAFSTPQHAMGRGWAPHPTYHRGGRYYHGRWGGPLGPGTYTYTYNAN